MKNHFPAYFRVDRKIILNNFDKFIVMLDASALLDIFRLPNKLSEQVFTVLYQYKKQVRIPYQAAQEFLQNIHGVLTSQIKQIEKTQNDLSCLIQSLSSTRSQPYISNKSSLILKKLEKSISEDFKQQIQHLKEQLLYGIYQNKILDLLNGCVLDSLDEEEISKIKKEGDIRYNNHIPPGWKDADKSENRYGDLIIWKEILKFAKERKNSILFITNDQKDDWIIREHGMTICPQYALLSEFYNEVESSDIWFHIYTLDSFLDFINEKKSGLVSEETINEVRNSLHRTIFDSSNQIMDLISNYSRLQSRLSISEPFNSYDQLLSLYQLLAHKDHSQSKYDLSTSLKNTQYNNSIKYEDGKGDTTSEIENTDKIANITDSSTKKNESDKGNSYI